MLMRFTLVSGGGSSEQVRPGADDGGAGPNVSQGYDGRQQSAQHQMAARVTLTSVTHSDETGSGPRPKSVMLTFLAIHLLGRASAIYSGSVIEVFGRVGVSEEAVRSTLTRMAGTGLLTR